MRIISGTWKGKALKVPREGTRPSMDRTRQALFNLLQNVVEGAVVLDLYAGSGALALEALSRGATRAVAVEREGAACRVIKENARALKAETLTVIEKETLDYLDHGSGIAPFSLIFADPPYEKEFVGSELRRLLSNENLRALTTPETLFITESPREISPEELAPLENYWKVVTHRRYGKAHLTVFTRKP